MKRIISLLIAILMLSSCMAMTVSADTCDISIWHGYEQLTHNGDDYMRFDSSNVEFEYEYSYGGVLYDIEEIDYVDYELSKNDTIITAYMYFNDGSSLTASFINENYYYEYKDLTGFIDEYKIDFVYPEENHILASSDAVFGEGVYLNRSELWDYEQFDVVAECSDGSFYVRKGELLIVDDQYYYVDYDMANIEDPDEFYATEQEKLQAYKITDTELLTQLDSAYAEYDSDTLGFLFDGFTDAISIIFLVLTFAIIPLAALIVFLILAARSKTAAYKKMFTTVCIISASELIIFTITVISLIFAK